MQPTRGSGRAGTVRIGVDTGGTFTDVVAVETSTGVVTTTKTPTTPADPADGFLAGVAKILDLIGATPDDISSIEHGTTVATNQLLEGKVGDLGFITTEGYEFVLEIARQSVPDGYGNSYFWVKPDRIVPADRVKTVGGRLDFRGTEVRPFDREAAVRAVRWFKSRGISTLGVCFLHSYANDAHERAMGAVIAAEFPEAVVSLSCDVLREYREYERSMTTLVDAAVKPRVAAYVSGIARRLEHLGGSRRIPFSVMRSNGGRAVRGRGGPPADHDSAVRARCRRARRRDDRRERRLPVGGDPRRRRDVHRCRRSSRTHGRR